jgi:hypothetical protein
MLLTAVAVLIGLGIGLALPPRTTRFARPRIRLLPLLVVGVIGQVVANRMTGHGAVALGLVALGLLVGFAVANLHLTGMGVMAIGLGLNLLVMMMNGGMPVSARALRAADVPAGELQGARHVEQSNDDLTVLGDIIPVGGQVVSYGDLIIAVAMADVIANLVRRQRRQLPTAASINTASPVHDWGIAPSPEPSSASQYSASPDATAPRTLVAATSAPASHNK